MGKQNFQVSIDFVGNVSDLQNKIRGLASEINKVGNNSIGNSIQKQFGSLTTTIENLKTRLKQPISSQGQFDKIVSDVNKVEEGYDRLLETINQLKKTDSGQLLTLLSGKEQADIKKANNALKTYDNTITKVQSNLKQYLAIQNRQAEAEGIKQTAISNLEQYSNELTKAKENASALKAELEQLQTKQAGLKAERNSLKGQISSITKKENAGQTLGPETEQVKQRYQQINAEIDKMSIKIAQVTAKQKLANNEVTQLQQAFDKVQVELEEAKVKIEQCTTELDKLGGSSSKQTEAAFTKLKEEAKELGISLEGIGSGSQDDIERLKQRFQEFGQNGVNKALLNLEQLQSVISGKVGGSLDTLKGKLSETTNEFDAFNRKTQDLNQLESYFSNIFSGVNALFLLRRAFKNTVETVKELDAAMTETAVVTDFSVGDMWKKLPEYTTQANKLSTSITSMYEATTLYYQQGLNSEQAMALGTETLKMARIAGLEAADATDKMTAALRGFNMEINEQSARRVNDVYSELAAITASNVDEISTAMTKTASIASSANMEFETTAALLAQIIN